VHENLNEDYRRPSRTALDPGPTIADSERVDARPDGILRLQEISTLLIQGGGLDSFYERLLDAAVDLMSADMGSIQTFHPELDELRLLACRKFHPESAAFWQRVHLDSASVCGKALSEERRIVVPDTETCDFMAGTSDLDEIRRSNIRAVQSTPLVSRSGRLVGMISTHWHEPHQPTEREFRSLDVLARQAADLIENTEVEATLRESEQQSRWLASVTESSDDAIISKTLDGRIMSWNQGAERLFGYPAEEMIGIPITVLIPPDRQNEERMILEKIAGGERVDHYETVRRRKDGGSVAISLTVSPVKNIEGRIIGASKIARDITERKQAEARENALITQLAQMNRMATAGELSASIAHEVNQPIVGVVLMASAASLLLSRDVPDIPKTRDILADIVNAAHHASEVVAGVQAMFKKSTDNRLPVDIKKLILTVLQIVRIECERNGVEVQADLADELPDVVGDSVQLQQVVLNLVMNAIEAMHSAPSRILRIETRQDGPGMVRVSVGDTGAGIDPSNVGRVFERLFTTKSQGMGMGLAICQSIIQSHDGRIWVASAPGNGSVFHFELPAACGAAVA
jgi:two-component system sensor kinase FixL